MTEDVLTVDQYSERRTCNWGKCQREGEVRSPLDGSWLCRKHYHIDKWCAEHPDGPWDKVSKTSDHN